MTSFKLIAGTNIGLRQNNEDNFTVCADLSKNDWGIPVNYHEEIELGNLGCVLVVADGMGGQNAGEVASSIAIETVHEMFSVDVLPTNVLESSAAIDNYLKKVICEADLRIKKVTRDNPSTSGMGSTIVIAWIIEKLVHVAWLGDSRAYCIIKDKGIARLTKDHSYVQSLVDAGKITDDQAITHPDSNIINRSLGDTSQKAKPDVVSIELTEGEVILLCSDGLCGVCRDAVIGGIVEDNISDLRECREELISAALEAGGSDNITIAMIYITQCDNGAANPKIVNAAAPHKIKWNYVVYLLLVSVIAVLIGLLIHMSKPQISYLLEVTPESVTLNKGETKALVVKYHTLIDNVIDQDKTKDVTDECCWSSTAPRVVSVSESGIITAIGADSSSRIIVVYGNCSDTVSVYTKPYKIVEKSRDISVEMTGIPNIQDLLDSQDKVHQRSEDEFFENQITPSAPDSTKVTLSLSPEPEIEPENCDTTIVNDSIKVNHN